MLYQVSQQVCAAVQQAGAECVIASPEEAPDLSQFELVFIGISAYGFSKRMEALSLVARSPSSEGKSYRVFCVHSGSGKAVLEQVAAILESKKALLAASLRLECRGLLKHFGKGSLGEGELSRAAAFGERGAASIVGARARPRNEKLRIPGYDK